MASIEGGIEIDDITPEQRKGVYVSLYQTHLPPLPSAGIAEYDQKTGEVTLQEINEWITYLLSDEFE